MNYGELTGIFHIVGSFGEICVLAGRTMTQFSIMKRIIHIMNAVEPFGVVSQFSDDIFVMYAGRCVESASKKDLLRNPKHPYTVGLIRSVPLLEARKTKRLKSIPGFPPDMSNVPEGCPFASRCEYAKDICHKEVPALKPVGEGHMCACHFPLDYDINEDTELG